MKRYKLAILSVAILASLPCILIIVLGFLTFHIPRTAIGGGVLLLWWLAYRSLRRDLSLAFWGSFVLVNLFWWPLLIKTINRVWFVIENGGLDRADGHGSPAGFLIGVLLEQTFFLPLTFAMVSGILVIIEMDKKAFALPRRDA